MELKCCVVWRSGLNVLHTNDAGRIRQYACLLQFTLQARSGWEAACADSITIHLREDRRHIQENDVRELKKILKKPMNLEMAVTDEMLAFAEEIKPEYCCFVPEKREELTTEGGLDVFSQSSKIKEASERLKDAGIRVSLFIDTDEKQIIAAADTLAPYIEIHTGHYADASNQKNTEKELENIKSLMGVP